MNGSEGGREALNAKTPRSPGTICPYVQDTQVPGRAIYGCTSTLCMTRKDEMREGFVARTFHIPEDIDDELRMMAVKIL
jgi:hypothetical protein